MTVETAAPDKDGITDLKAESAKRLAAHAAKQQTPAAKAPATVPPKENAASTEPGEGSGGKAKPAAKQDADPESDADLSHIPDEFAVLREAAKSDKKIAEFLKTGILKEKDYRTKTMAVADERKALEARKQAADVGEGILSDPDEMRLIYEHREAKRLGKQSASSEPKPKFDPLLATAEEWDARLAEVETRAEKRSFDKFVETFVTPQTEKQAMAVLVHAEYIAKAGYTADEVNKAWDEMVLDTESVGGKVTKENAVGRLARFLPPKATPKAEATNGSGETGASPLGRNGGRLSPVPPPKVMQDKPDPHTWTTKERAQVAFWRVSQRTGRKVTPESIGVSL